MARIDAKRPSRPRQLIDIVRRSVRSARIALMVVHTTQGHNRPGVSDLEGLADFFRGVEADSTFGVDQEGHRSRFKPDGDKPWTQAAFNSKALSVEQVGFAEESRRYWIVDYHNGLRTVAEILADWSVKYRLPLRLSTSLGACEHKHLGAAGGGHVDCGPNYPIRYVLWWARYIKLYRQNKKIRAARYARKIKRVQRGEGVKNPTTWYRGN